MSKPSAVILLSGGMDSQVLLASQRGNYGYVHAVGFRYGQRHVRELKHALQIAHYYGAMFRVVDIERIAGSALTDFDSDIPKGLHYTDPQQAATVVPGRNAVMLSHAASLAVQFGCRDVLFAAHAGDAAIYGDCRREFVEAFSKAMKLAYSVGVVAPFLSLTKREIASLGREFRVQFGDSWSCYEGGVEPCGQCGACVERLEALC